jgi:hypothetical protein
LSWQSVPLRSRSKHAQLLDVQLEPNGTVTNVVRLQNPGAVDVDDISVRIEAHEVFAELEAVDAASGGV